MADRNDTETTEIDTGATAADTVQNFSLSTEDGDALFTVGFWKRSSVRAIKTFAQTAIAMLGVSTTGIIEVDWVNVLSVAGLAAVTSYLTSISSADSI